MDVSGNELPHGAQLRADKAEWRARLLAARAEVPAEVRASEASALAAAVASLPVFDADAVVCCYVPFGSEPGSIDLLDELRDTGRRVLLPVVPDQRGPLEWAEYDGMRSLTEGVLPGLLEPAGERLPPEALREATVVLVPALAVDHIGVRIGRGAGYYDRSLLLAAAGTDLIAVVRDSELVPRLPAEPHDVRLTGALTPSSGLVRLPLV